MTTARQFHVPPDIGRALFAYGSYYANKYGDPVWQKVKRRAAGTPLGTGRFDVAAATLELAAPPIVPPSREDGTLRAGAEVERTGSPLRTRPWPYLLVIGLLCAEWIGRRRSGLR